MWEGQIVLWVQASLMPSAPLDHGEVSRKKDPLNSPDVARMGRKAR